jgi:putative endonuclease
MRHHYTYILSGPSASKGAGGPIFIGTTRDLRHRLTQHRIGRASYDAFRIDQLVHAERHDSIEAATSRAAALKKASREWVDALIERKNPDWRDLTDLAKEKAVRAA